MQTDPSGLERYELKYAITEAQAEAIRDHIQPLFSLDPHADPQQRGYIVNNVYLDTPGLRFYYDTKLRRERRLKPRVRYYGTEPGLNLVMEVKHRHNNATWKTRRWIPSSQWPAALEVTPSPRRSACRTGLPQDFVSVTQMHNAAPVVHVRYVREPYISDIDAYGRITFDRQLRYSPAHGSYEIGGGEDDMILYDDPVTARSEESPVVLEIKTDTLVPFWAIDLVRRFSLVQRGYSKYCYAIDRCLEGGYLGAGLGL